MYKHRWVWRENAGPSLHMTNGMTLNPTTIYFIISQFINSTSPTFRLIFFVKLWPAMFGVGMGLAPFLVSLNKDMHCKGGVYSHFTPIFLYISSIFLPFYSNFTPYVLYVAPLSLCFTPRLLYPTLFSPFRSTRTCTAKVLSVDITISVGT